MKYKTILSLLIGIFLISLASASVVCSSNSISVTYQEGQTPSSQSVTCTNSDVNNSVSVNKVGSYFSTSPITPITINAGEANKNITISFQSAPAGVYTGYLYFSDSSTPITITMTAQQQQSGECVIDIFPTILSGIKITQGEKKSRQIQLSIPACYSTSVSLNGVSLSTDEKPISLGEFQGGVVQKGNSVLIPLEIDATTASTGSYSDTLSFLLYNSSGSRINVASVSITVLVTTGITPLSNYSFEQLPTCSLNAVQMSLNSSYKMTCSIINSNILIQPVIDSKYIKGLSVTKTSSQYVYEFQPLIVGTTIIGAEFVYELSRIGTPFSQEVKISPSGSAPAGSVNLDVDYFQSGTKKDISQLSAGDVTILILDSLTKSIVPSFLVYLNGLSVNNTFKLDSDKKYELRVTSPNYIDRVVNISVSKLPLGIIITPDKGTFEVGDLVNVSTSPENGSILMNNVVVTSPISLLSEGVFTLKAVKEGYESTERNITVKKSIYITSGLESYDKWVVGTNVALSLSDNANWNVTYNGTAIASGNDNIIKFKIEKAGKYEINAKGNMIASKTIENKGWFSWFKWYYWFWIIGGIILVWLVFYVGREKKEGGSSGFILSPKFSSQEG